MMTTTTGPRFAGLQQALAETRPRGSTSSTRLAAHLAAKAGASASAGDKKVASAPGATSRVAPSTRANATPTKSQIVIPPDVAAMGSEAVAAYKVGHARAEARLAELARNPAIAGRSGQALALFNAGRSNAEIVAELTKEARAKAADDVWARARASVDGSRTATAGNEETARQTKPRTADDVWARARASLGLTCEN